MEEESDQRPDLEDQLARLARLKEEGVLTEAEFLRAKDRLRRVVSYPPPEAQQVASAAKIDQVHSQKSLGIIVLLLGAIPFWVISILAGLKWLSGDPLGIIFLVLVAVPLWFLSIPAGLIWLVWKKTTWPRLRRWQATSAVVGLTLLFGVGAILLNTMNEKRLQSALGAFETYLAAEEFTSAQKELQSAKAIDGNDPRTGQAQKRLNHAIARAARYRQGRELIRKRAWTKAILALAPIREYKDTAQLLVHARYEGAREAISDRRWSEARRLLEPLPATYRDANVLLANVKREETAEKSRAALREAERLLAEWEKEQAQNRAARNLSEVLIRGTLDQVEENLQAVKPEYLSSAERQRYRAVNARFRRVLSRVEADSQALAKRLLISYRQAYVEELERRLLDRGLDVYITLEGREKTTMRMKYILWSRPLVYKFIKDETIVAKLRELGFRRLIFHTGYEYWTFDL